MNSSKLLWQSIFYCALFLLYLSCQNEKLKNSFSIRGDISNLNASKVYLINIRKHDLVIDSAEVVNKNFMFNVKADSVFSPYIGCILYYDTSDGRKIYRTLGFKNPYIAKMVESCFYVDGSDTYIKGEVNKVSFLDIEGSKQNIPLYQHVSLNELSLDKVKRQEQIHTDLIKIKKYPYSYFLLQNLYERRSQYSKSELETYLSFFNDEIRKSKTFYYLKNFDPQKQNSIDFTSFHLSNRFNKKEAILDSSKKANLLIAWASWCGPCIREIPYLKQLYLEYGRNVSFTSISFDNNPEEWEKLLDRLNMPWKQLIATDEFKEELVGSFHLNSIPFMVLVGHKGGPLATFSGNSKEVKDSLNQILHHALN